MEKNLLRSHWTVEKIESLLTEVPRHPLLPPLGSNEWRRPAGLSQTQSALAALRQAAEIEADEPLPELTDELYASFHRDGIRLPFERSYFECRRRLARVAMALLLANEGDALREKFQRSFLTKLTGIFEEASWSLPAHVGNSSGKDTQRIDLFCAETANLMAEILDVFGTLIPTDLQKQIRARLQRDIFENYLQNWTKMEWPGAGMNWNAVCHQGVIGSALSQVEDPRLLAEMLVIARECLPLFLAGFTPDGGCTEGPGYWDYGFGWFTVLNEQLETRTQGRLSLVEGDGHVRAISRFGPLTQLPFGKFVNFSDGGAEGTLRPSTLRYLGERLNDSLCLRLSEANYHVLGQKGIDRDALRCDFFYLGRLFLRWPSQAAAETDPMPEDVLLPDLGVLVAHGRDRDGRWWDLAAKGGNNHEHHNHNDCGSYLLNIDGERLVAEIGAPEYVRDFFGSKRYEFLAARSRGHSLPVINGIEQAAGDSFAARILNHRLDSGRAEFQLDLTACYPPEARCSRCVRIFVWDKTAGRLEVSDEFDLAEANALETAVITPYPVLIQADYVVIRSERTELVVRPKAGTVLAAVEKHVYSSHRGTAAFVHRLVWKPAVLTKSTRVEYSLESNALEPNGKTC